MHLIQLNWIDLPAAAKLAQNVPGVYFLGASFTIKYGRKNSRVFYIGGSGRLRSRLAQHINDKERGNFLLSKIATVARDNIYCSFQEFPSMRASHIAAVEAATLHTFGVKHGFFPHGNRLPPEVPDSADWDEEISLVEQDDLSIECLDEEEIASRFDMRVSRDPYPLYRLSGSSGLGMVINSDDVFSSCSQDESYYSINFMRRRRKDKDLTVQT